MVRCLDNVAYAARAMCGFFALHLPVSAKVRRDFRLDLLSALLSGAFSGLVVGYIYVVARTIGVSQFGISVLVSMGAVGCMLSLPASLVVKGSASRVFLFAALILSRGILLPLAVLSGPATYMFAVSVSFIAGGVTGPFYAEIMEHIYPREFRGQLMNLVRVGSGSVMTISSLLAAWLLGSGYLTYQALFGVGGVLGLASLYIFSRITPVRPPPRPHQSFRDTIAILGV